MTQASLSMQTAPGHQVMAAAGKKVLRPGGKAATETLLQWANFQPGESVLELAASFGYSAMALAQRYGVQVVGVEKNPDSVARAQANVQAAGLADRVTIVAGDIFHLDRIPDQFDYVLAEAIVTMQSAPGKAKVLRGVRDRLKPGGKFLSHELIARARAEEIHQALTATLRVNSTPLSPAGWQEALEEAGLTLVRQHTGAMGLLSPARVIQDEGLVDAAKFAWNVLTHPPIRQRLGTIRQVFNQYESDLGYILQLAERS